MRRAIVISWIGLLFSTFGARVARGQDAASAIVPSARLLEDVAVLERVYETLHPGLYR